MNGLEEKSFDTILEKVDKLKPIAESVGATVAQLAIAWVPFFIHLILSSFYSLLCRFFLTFLFFLFFF